jgi:hypothetical protein
LLGMLGAIRFLSSAGAVRCRPKGSNPAGPLALSTRARGKILQFGRRFCTRNHCGKLRTPPGTRAVDAECCIGAGRGQSPAFPIG